MLKRFKSDHMPAVALVATVILLVILFRVV